MSKRIRGYCIDCNEGIPSRKSIRCRNCYNEFLKTKSRPTHERVRYWHIYKKYNLSEKDFLDMLNKNNYKCEICNKTMIMLELKRGQSLGIVSIDHCHNTNKVRGLLCGACNKGIGLLKDDINILEAAIKYLKKENKNETISLNPKSS